MGKKSSESKPAAPKAAAEPKAKPTQSILLNEGPDHGQYAQIPQHPKSEFFSHNGNNYRITQGGYAHFCGRDEKPADWMLAKKE